MNAKLSTSMGKYDLLARIAKGGMAEIYLAHQRGMVGFSRLVVIKRILPHLAEEPHFVRMFLEEARIAALVNHPNVVQIHDVDQHEGNYYIAMEYINGPSLSTIIRQARNKAKQIPYSMAAEIIAQACAGLHAAHELKDEDGAPLQLVHRDVSPHNLMVSESGLVKLVDFGIAKAQDSAVKTRTGNIKGKYPYMSPEQCRGELLDRRTDLFSLGVVFFELIVGQRLFHRNTELLILKAITEEPIPRVHDFKPDVPLEISDLVDQCLARSLEYRFPTAAAMEAAVRETLARLCVETSPAGLAAFMRQEYGALLDKRETAVRRVSRMSRSGSRVPVVDGLDSGDHAPPSSSAESVGPSIPTLHRRTKSLGPLVRYLLLALAIVLIAVLSGLTYRFFSHPSRPAGPLLLFGMAPSFPAPVARQEMAPLLAYLERRMNRRFELVIPQAYAQLREDLLQGRLAFAHLPPLQYVLARHENPQLKALVSHLYEGTRTYQALIVARDDSKITRVTEIAGKRFCYVDPESTSGYLLPRYYLRRQGLDPERVFALTRFSGNHIQVMKDILAGKCEAGAIYSGALIAAPKLGLASSRLFHLAVTGQLPHEVITAGPSLPAETARSLQQALLELNLKQELGRRLLGDALRISGFAKTEYADFDLVEKAARSEGLIK